MTAIDDLVRQGLDGALRDETQVVYVSPLKALSNDIRKNLDAPLSGIRAALREQGLGDVDIRTWVRTGGPCAGLCGEDDAPVIIDAGHRRARDLALEVPDSPLEAVMAAEVWDQVYRRLADLVGEHRTTLIFVNTHPDGRTGDAQALRTRFFSG
jgi:Lhr-like helicase